MREILPNKTNKTVFNNSEELNALSQEVELVKKEVGKLDEKLDNVIEQGKNIEADDAVITYIDSERVSSGSVIADEADIESARISNLNATKADVDELDVKVLKTESFNPATANIPDLTTSDLKATSRIWSPRATFPSADISTLVAINLGVMSTLDVGGTMSITGKDIFMRDPKGRIYTFGLVSMVI